MLGVPIHLAPRGRSVGKGRGYPQALGVSREREQVIINTDISYFSHFCGKVPDLPNPPPKKKNLKEWKELFGFTVCRQGLS